MVCYTGRFYTYIDRSELAGLNVYLVKEKVVNLTKKGANPTTPNSYENTLEQKIIYHVLKCTLLKEAKWSVCTKVVKTRMKGSLRGGIYTDGHLKLTDTPVENSIIRYLQMKEEAVTARDLRLFFLLFSTTYTCSFSCSSSSSTSYNIWNFSLSFYSRVLYHHSLLTFSDWKWP